MTPEIERTKAIRLGASEPHLHSNPYQNYVIMSIWTSVNRSGDFLDFGQLFKAFGNKDTLLVPKWTLVILM